MRLLVCLFSSTFSWRILRPPYPAQSREELRPVGSAQAGSRRGVACRDFFPCGLHAEAQCAGRMLRRRACEEVLPEGAAGWQASTLRRRVYFFPVLCLKGHPVDKHGTNFFCVSLWEVEAASVVSKVSD